MLIKKKKKSKLQLYYCNDVEQRQHWVRNQHWKHCSGQVQEKYHLWQVNQRRRSKVWAGLNETQERGHVLEKCCAGAHTASALGLREGSSLFSCQPSPEAVCSPRETSFGAARAAAPTAWPTTHSLHVLARALKEESLILGLLLTAPRLHPPPSPGHSADFTDC